MFLLPDPDYLGGCRANQNHVQTEGVLKGKRTAPPDLHHHSDGISYDRMEKKWERIGGKRRIVPLERIGRIFSDSPPLKILCAS